MKRRKTNIKPMFLLILLAVFSFFVINKTEGIDWEGKKQKMYESKPAECTTCKTGEGIKEIIDNDSSINYVLLDSSQAIDVTEEFTGSVEGIMDFGCRGLDPANFLSSKRYVCSTSGGGGIDFSEGDASSGGQGVLVKKNSKIKITKVTFPLALWLGQYTYVDSNKQIRKDSPDYRSNGQQLDPEIVSRSLSPEEATQFNDEISGTEKEPFVVKGKVKMDTGQVENLEQAEGEYQVENAPHEPGCILNGKPCDSKLAVSDYNVGKSNYIASNQKYGGYMLDQAPGGDKKPDSASEECLVEGQDYKELKNGVVTTCVNVPAIIAGWFMETFGLSQWEKCTIGEEIQTIDPKTGKPITINQKSGECVDPKTLGIKMTPIFGDPDVCEDELCANAYLSQSYKETLAPSESKGVTVSGSPKTSTMFFVATECALQIDGKNVPVLCLWDASPILLNYKLQEKDKAPNQEDFPKSFTYYWGNVSQSMKISSKVYRVD